ncbi:MAG: hypothetical protein H6732_09730 [Alphaproteobacteria bacterium]|nr:hypothetical protein [Alphaproteobacteria bacterium]
MGRVWWMGVLVACGAPAGTDLGDTDTDGDTSTTDTAAPDDTGAGPDDSGDVPDGVCVTQVIEDADGDGQPDSRVRIEVDGTTTTTFEDLDGDGSWEVETVVVTDASGDLVLSEVVRLLPSGRLYARAETMLDADGRVVRGEVDDDGDGRPELVVENAYYPTGELYKQTVRQDADSNGKRESVRVQIFEPEGYPIAVDEDLTDDGVRDRWSVCARVDSVVTCEVFATPGTRTSVARYTYDGEIRRTRYERDSSADDVFDGADDLDWTYTWSPGGNPLVDQGDGVAGPRDGVVDRETRRAYDAAERMLELEERTAGALDSRHTWTYDAEGRVLTDLDDSDGDGVVELGVRAVRDAQGRVTEAVYVQEGADIAKETTTFTGRDAVRLTDVDIDGTVDVRSTLLYDDHDRLLKQEDDAKDDGSVDRRVTATYSCPPTDGA